MWNVHLDPIKMVKHRNNIEKTNSGPIHSTLYQAGTEKREFEKQKIYQMLSIALSTLPIPSGDQRLFSSQKKGQNPPLLCRLSEINCSDDLQFVTDTEHVRMY